MTDSPTWLVDRIAAVNIARDLDLRLSEAQMRYLSDRLAEHRINTVGLGVTRIQSKISETIHSLLRNRRHLTSDWSDGCTSAEAAVHTVTASILAELRPYDRRSAGQGVSTMVRHARNMSPATPGYRKIEAPIGESVR